MCSDMLFLRSSRVITTRMCIPFVISTKNKKRYILREPKCRDYPWAAEGTGNLFLMVFRLSQIRSVMSEGS